MIAVAGTTQSLEIKLAGAATTTELPITAAFVAINQTTLALVGATSFQGITTGATPVVLSAAPGANVENRLNALSVVNVDTAAVTVTVQVDVSATKRIAFKTTLSVGDTLVVTHLNVSVLDANGSVKSAMGGVLPAANFPALSGDVSTVAGSLVTTIGALKVTNAMLAGSIAASKLVGADITTVGTLVAGATGAGFTVALSTSTITGSLADARLSANVPLLNAANTFTGALNLAGALTHGTAEVNAIVNTPVSQYWNIDSDNDAGGELFSWGTNRTSGAGGTTLMTLTDVGLLTVSATNGLALTLTATTGTALLLDAGGLVRTLTSSARDKEHISTWVVPPDALARFVALSPQNWDYKGQRNGAAGFISEDLDALGILNAYGTSPLVNYDTEGRPESNRDFALIGLGHLVLQDHDKRLAALERKGS